MLDFDYDPITKRPTLSVEQAVPDVVERVVVVTRPSTRTAFIARPDAEWGWEDLRDFVVAEVEARHGAQHRDQYKEAGIFKGFLARYGERAVPIALLAFGSIFDGMWRSAPITVTRFCKGSDPYFADLLAQRL